MDGEKRLSRAGPEVNNEKTIFMKCQGDDFIIHCLFVDNMMHVPTCDELQQEFMEKYTMDFQITGGGLMEKFWGKFGHAGLAIAG